jgi:transcriptional regulatory protein RtcR
VGAAAGPTLDPLLLMGPTGAGKSRLARHIYELKKARHTVKGEFVDVNCATVRGDGAMSALFGHTKGAFTGALKDRPGLLRAADGGILFLGEIGELGLDEQAMLLRVGALEGKTFLPLGSDRESQSDFQLIAGTNRDLFAAARHGRFREDLLARINIWTFSLPGLEARPEDIKPNLQFELDQHARKTRNHRQTVGSRFSWLRRQFCWRSTPSRLRVSRTALRMWSLRRAAVVVFRRHTEIGGLFAIRRGRVRHILYPVV